MNHRTEIDPVRADAFPVRGPTVVPTSALLFVIVLLLLQIGHVITSHFALEKERAEKLAAFPRNQDIRIANLKGQLFPAEETGPVILEQLKERTRRQPRSILDVPTK